MFSVFRFHRLRIVLAFVLAIPVAVAAAFAWWASTPIPLATSPLDFSVRVGSTARSAAMQIRAQGAALSPRGFYWLARLSGEGTQLKAGSYEITAGTTPWQLLRKMARGDESLLALSIPEGWTFARMREAMETAPGLVHDATGLSDADIMRAVGAPAGRPPEGWFFPDTYLYAPGSSELALLGRAYRAMRARLDAAWDARAPDLPLSAPAQALTLASIVEKETGRPEDRARVAAVFINRLRAGMPLQSDPTIIYALGPSYDGRLHRQDLHFSSPYNTYEHGGLPPGPIALPGEAALRAVLHPAPGRALYFVARGDGSSAFSDTLMQHNAAVDKYILKKTP